MKRRNIAATILTGLAFLICSTSAHAGVTEVYVSFSDIGGPRAQDNTQQTYTVGESGAAFIWLNDSTDVDTLSVVNAVLSNPGTVSFTNAEVMNPNIAGSQTQQTRWDTMDHGFLAPNGVSVSGLSGGSFTPSSTGILLNQMGDDEGFDASNGTDSFLLARLDFVVESTGTVDINLSGLLLNETQPLNFSTGSATINVEAIPEPAAGIGMIIATCLFTRRRR